MERWLSAELPTESDENWRYSRISEFDLEHFRPAPVAPSTPRGGAKWSVSDHFEPPRHPDSPIGRAQRLLERIPARAGVVVTSGGEVVGVELAPEATAKGVTLERLTQAGSGPELLGAVAAQMPPGQDGSFGDLADAFASDGIVLSVPKGAELSHPVVVIHELTGAGSAFFPRTIVQVGENAEASVVELFVSSEEVMLVLPTIELSVADGARLDHEVVQQLGSNTWQFSRLFAVAGRDAGLKSFQGSLGGHVARSSTSSILTGQGGSAQLLAAYFGDGDQMHDFRTLQEHAAPRTTSDLVFKGAVAGQARSVYTGMIRMRHGAKGANAFQTNRNLVLSDGAHADSVPNLDIQENDVRCSHASAVGPIDPEQLFYVESRGVPREVAERLILLGFFEELLERVSDPVRASVIEWIASALEVGLE